MRFKNGADFVKSLASEYCPEPSVSNSIRLAHYFTKAHNLYYKALDFVKAGNDSRAYIELMRFSQLVIKLNEHNAYKEKQYTNDRNLNKRRLNNAILKLEELKPKIIEEYNNQIKLEAEAKLHPKPATPSAPPAGPSAPSGNDAAQPSAPSAPPAEDDADEQKQPNNNSNSNVNNSDEKTQDKSNLPSNQRWNNLLIPSAPPDNSNNNNNNSNNSNVGSNGSGNGSKSRSWGRSLDNIFNTPKKSIIHIPQNTVQSFIGYAAANTKRDIETCGVLCGQYQSGDDSYKITHVIIPKQKGTANTVQTLHEEELISIQEKYSVVQLGWIHTHPSQTCFLSSVDMHCQLSYQIMMPNGIAIVHAPTDKTQVFTLTSKGIDILSKCNCQGFHRHEGTRGIYEVANHVKYTKDMSVKIIDLRL